MLDADTERTLRNLWILGAMAQNDKLMTTDTTFNICPPSTYRGVMRAWYGENRALNLERVEAAVRRGIQYVLTPIDAGATPEHAMRASQRSRMATALARAAGGLENMKETYKDDAATVAHLTLLVQECTAVEPLVACSSARLRQHTRGVVHCSADVRDAP